jgi:hypothetical protein
MHMPRRFPSPARRLRTAAITLVSVFVISSTIFAGDTPRVGILGDVRVEKGEVYSDDLVCIGGKATVEGTVEGDVVVIGGTLDFSGEARNVVVIGGKATIASGSVIQKDLVHMMGTFDKAPDVTVHGQSIDVGSHLPPHIQKLLSRGLLGLIVVLRVISIIISLAVILLIVLLAPERVERMSGTLEPRWPASLGFGVLGYVVFIVLAIVLAVTLIGIPLAVLLGLAVWVLGLMGIAAIMMALGRRVGLGTGLIGPDPSVLSCVSVGFLVVALVRFIPVVGELAWLLLTVMGLGLALITKVGSPSATETAS